MGNSLPLPGPSSAYFNCFAQLTRETAPDVILFDADNRNFILRAYDNICFGFDEKSDYIVKFTKIDNYFFRKYRISFVLTDTKTNESIISAKIEFEFSATDVYSQILVIDPNYEWTGTINPIQSRINTPTGSLRLISPKKDVLFFDFVIDTSNANVTKCDVYGIGYYINLQNDNSSSSTQNPCQLISENNDLTIQIFMQSDSWGLNLIEMSCTVTAKKKYPNSYPSKLIGYCKKLQPQTTDLIQTKYSFNPNIRKVLKLEGENLLDQTNNINKKYNNVDISENLKNCEFYNRIITYSSIRYYLGGLSSNGDFSCKWLCSNNYHKFLRNLENSDFYEAIVIFKDPCYGYVDFNKYYRKCKCNK